MIYNIHMVYLIDYVSSLFGFLVAQIHPSTGITHPQKCSAELGYMPENSSVILRISSSSVSGKPILYDRVVKHRIHIALAVGSMPSVSVPSGIFRKNSKLIDQSLRWLIIQL